MPDSVSVAVFRIRSHAIALVTVVINGYHGSALFAVERIAAAECRLTAQPAQTVFCNQLVAAQPPAKDHLHVAI